MGGGSGKNGLKQARCPAPRLIAHNHHRASADTQVGSHPSAAGVKLDVLQRHLQGFTSAKTYVVLRTLSWPFQ